MSKAATAQRDPATGGGGIHPQPGRIAPPPRASRLCRNPGHALARYSRTATCTRARTATQAPNGNGHIEEEEEQPAVGEVLSSFGVAVRQAQNQLVLRTTSGAAQPVALAIDHEEWHDVLGTLAGDDTVLIICPDPRRASHDAREAGAHDRLNHRAQSTGLRKNRNGKESRREKESQREFAKNVRPQLKLDDKCQLRKPEP